MFRYAKYILFCTTFLLFAQQKLIDSSKTIIKTSKEDTNKAKILNELSAIEKLNKEVRYLLRLKLKNPYL